MPSLDAGSRYLDAKLALPAVAGETVTYLHDLEPVTLTDVVIGETPIGFDFGTGNIIQSWQTTDFLIPAASLALFGSEFVPQPGHRIVRTVLDQTIPFEVRNADDGRCFRYSDAVTREMLRVHCKEVMGKEDVPE